MHTDVHTRHQVTSSATVRSARQGDFDGGEDHDRPDSAARVRDRGRAAYTRRDWAGAFDLLSSADRAASLEPADAARCAFWLGVELLREIRAEFGPDTTVVISGNIGPRGVPRCVRLPIGVGGCFARCGRVGGSVASLTDKELRRQ